MRKLPALILTTHKLCFQRNLTALKIRIGCSPAENHRVCLCSPRNKCLFTENVKIRPKITNPNTINFTTPNRFEPLRFMNSPYLGNDIANSEESDLYLDFKKTVTYSQQNSKYISKRRPPVVVNAHPENQTTFSKVSTFTGDKSYRDAVTKKQKQKRTNKKQQENILIFSNSIPSKIKMYNFDKALENGKTKHLSRCKMFTPYVNR